MLTRKASWRSVDYIYFMWMKRATHLSSPKRQWLYRMRMTMILVTNTSTMMRLNRCLRDTQCCQPVQIICICPDICAFSVLDNRHCADICTICQKCQFEVRKGWQVLLLQSMAEDMYCNHADPAILKLPFVQASMEQIYHIVSQQTYVVFTLFCRGMGYGLCPNCPIYSSFDSDFAQISGPKIGGWQLCSPVWLLPSITGNKENLTPLTVFSKYFNKYEIQYLLG